MGKAPLGGKVRGGWGYWDPGGPPGWSCDLTWSLKPTRTDPAGTELGNESPPVSPLPSRPSFDLQPPPLFGSKPKESLRARRSGEDGEGRGERECPAVWAAVRWVGAFPIPLQPVLGGQEEEEDSGTWKEPRDPGCSSQKGGEGYSALPKIPTCSLSPPGLCLYCSLCPEHPSSSGC